MDWIVHPSPCHVEMTLKELNAVANAVFVQIEALTEKHERGEASRDEQYSLVLLTAAMNRIVEVVKAKLEENK